MFYPKELLTSLVNSVLHEKSHDTSEKTVDVELYPKGSASTLAEAIREMREASSKTFDRRTKINGGEVENED